MENSETDQKATIEIIVQDGVTFSIHNWSERKNNPAFLIALDMVKLMTEVKDED